MKKKLRILHLASECAPYCKSGGLADVVGSVPQFQAKDGSTVFVAIPKYKDLKVDELEFVMHYDVYLSWRKQYVGVFKKQVDDVTYFFIDNQYYFGRNGLYGYGDDGERFGFFTIACMELIARLQLDPDIVHVHDWHPAMAATLYHERYIHFDFYQNIKFVLTIHNPAYQGLYDKSILGNIFGLNQDSYERGQTRFKHGVSYLKSGIVYSDFITTVSPTHRDELLRGEYAYELDSVLNIRKDDFVGILNGLDIDLYDPAIDPVIAFNYTKGQVSTGKNKNKKAIQKQFNLPAKNVPLFTFISRLTWQKGVDILIDAISQVIDQNIQIIILGNGDKSYEAQIEHLRASFPDKVACYIGFDQKVASQLYAAADFILMPSLFEPCGINQLIAMRYGTLPIVREVGGLKDSVLPYNEYDHSGTGFTFTRYAADDLRDCINRALAIYQNKDEFKKIRANALKQDVSWKKSAAQYGDVYKRILK